MDIHEATKQYELWLSAHLDLIGSDLVLKHERMAEKAFSFLRATYYRWCQVWQTLCPQLTSAPTVLSVGDIHLENFGTWRDAEGRLVWGVNDFDEVYVLPYTSDLLRLATSALVAIDDDHLSVGRGKVCDAIIQGYRNALSCDGRPFVLAEHHNWLRKIGLNRQRQPEVFWRKLGELVTWEGTIPTAAMNALIALLPSPAPFRVVHRTAGLGSLGRPRWVAIADWHGGKLAREAKPLAPSATEWAEQKPGQSNGYYQTVLDGAVRIADPFFKVVDSWVVRRLSPDCIKVELASLPTHRTESQLLECMGFELGNVHLASRAAISTVLADLEQRPANWLHESAKVMCKQVVSDWKDWRKLHAK